jgi:hypothetical protein
MYTVLRSVIAKMIQTYGIPTISGLLTTTKEFSSAETANKRFADTGILIREFVSSTSWERPELKLPDSLLLNLSMTVLSRLLHV